MPIRWLLAIYGLQLGCLSQLVPSHPAGSTAPSQIQPAHIPSDIFVTLNGNAEMHAELCDINPEHPNFPNDADLLTKVFCQDFAPGGQIPTPHSLGELLQLLGLDFKDRNGENGKGGNPGFALLGHSSALTARNISTIAPTAFVFTPPPVDGSKPSGYIFLAFDPGEQFVEIASHDATVDAVNFYLVLFDKECTHAPDGCKNTELLTPNLTQGWSNLRQYESTTNLNNTIADCRQCHASPNDSSPMILRMQENTAPFTHWFSQQTEGGRALLEDFHAAHGNTEDYGPIPAAMIDRSDPSLMAQMIAQAGFGEQPNAFDSAAIEREVAAMMPGQPNVNTPMGWSPTWQKTYDAAVAGNFIAAPYHDVKVTDPVKLANMSRVYQQWMAGTRSDLPDIRDVFLDAGLRDMSFAGKATLDGKGLLAQMCQQCHNANLDLTISREKFLVDQLGRMSRAEKDLAIDRLRTNLDSRLVMPPTLFRTITEEERALMVEELQK